MSHASTLFQNRYLGLYAWAVRLRRRRSVDLRRSMDLRRSVDVRRSVDLRRRMDLRRSVDFHRGVNLRRGGAAWIATQAAA